MDHIKMFEDYNNANFRDLIQEIDDRFVEISDEFSIKFNTILSQKKIQKFFGYKYIDYINLIFESIDDNISVTETIKNSIKDKSDLINLMSQIRKCAESIKKNNPGIEYAQVDYLRFSYNEFIKYTNAYHTITFVKFYNKINEREVKKWLNKTTTSYLFNS